MPRPLPSTALCALLALAATARADGPDCNASANPLDCRLNQYLHLLHVAAVVLVLVLLATLIFVIRIHRKNSGNRKDPYQ